AVKEDHALNKKVIKAIEAYIKNLTNLTELLILIKSFYFQGLKSLVKSLQASALRQDEHLAAWAKSSTSIAWNLSPRLISIESTQFALRYEIPSLKQDTYEIKSIMIEIFKAFKGEKAAHTANKESPSHTKGEISDMDTDKVMEKESENKQLRKFSSRPTLTNTILKILIPQPTGLVINITTPEQPESPPVAPKADKGKEACAYKVVHEEALKVGINPKILESAKGGQEFKKIQDAELKILNREHSQKVKRQLELKKKRLKKYMWTTSSRLKPKPITNVKIYPNSKPVVLTIYKGTHRRNFDVYNPFKFVNFGVTELDELGPIIEKKKNMIVELEYGIFFTDVFGDKAFQRWSDINKVGVETLITYLMASNITTPKRVRFYQKIKELIAKHPDQ
nr:hypothetical protein [Tanacetum cinerariifolium]